MRRMLILTIAAALAAVTPLAAQTTPKAMYAKLQAREQAARRAIESGRPAESVRKEVVRAISGYESLVSRFPRSGYSDNALWDAAMLSASSFARFHVDTDRAQALALLKRLAAEYPGSPLLRQAKPATARLSGVSEAPVSRHAAASSPTVPVPPPAAAPEHATEPPAPMPQPVPKPAVVAVTSTAAPPAHPSGSVAAIRAVRRTVLPDVVRIAIELDREVDFHHDRISNPDRVFVDLHGTEVTAGLQPNATWDDGIVKAVRIGPRPGGTIRVVLDLTAGGHYNVFTLYNPFRVVVDLDRTGRAPTVPAVAKASDANSDDKVVPATLEASRPLPVAVATPAPVAPLPAAPPEHEIIPTEETIKPAPPVDSVAPGATVAPAAAPSVEVPLPSKHAAGTAAAAASPGDVVPAPPSQNLQGRFSLSRQLGLGVSRIVIDPGHGGHDPGAQGKGIKEADLVLDVALRLQKLLLKSPGVEVVLTRSTDVFIPLEERTAIANRESADLFLSIHANASRNPSARGVETYFLNFASNPDAEAVAARENSASGQTMHNLPDIVKAITLNNKLDESRDFATLVQRSMVDHLASGNKSVRDLGVRQAPFVVLIGAGMPSVLAEISFLTHAQEGRLLKTGAYRQKIAEALFDGLRDYQRSLKNIKAASGPTGANGAKGLDAGANDATTALNTSAPPASTKRHSVR
jgi:N-acetylmuramoyl-L-alanine amidase